MKLSIFQKLFLKNRLISIVLGGAFGIWIVLQIPLVGLTIYFDRQNDNQLQEKINQDNEKLLIFTFQLLARFGDLVNSEQQIVEIGRPLGLVDFIVCKNGELLLSSPLHSACEDGKYLQANIAGENLDLLFKWSNRTVRSSGSNRSIFLLSIGSFLLILMLVFIVYLIFTSKIQSFALRILELQENPKALEGSEIMPELEPVVRKIRELIQQNEKSAQYEKQNIRVDIARQLAHDIRAPLSALNILVSTLPEMPKEHAELFRSSFERINRIAIDLLKDSRTFSDAKPFDVVSSIQNLIEEKTLKYTELNPTIHFYSAVDKLDLQNIEQIKFERIISNLLENSVEARNGKIEISIRIMAEPKLIKIEVEDNGIGISKENLDKIGQKGFSTKTLTDNSGAGLGVYSAIETIENWNGSIQFFSKENKGTLVEIKIPTDTSMQHIALCN